MDEIELRERIAKWEDYHTEFKERLPDNESLVKSLLCFANSDGGWLILGVDRSGDIPGIDDVDSALRRIDDLATERCEPPISLLPETLLIGGRTVLAVNIPRGTQRPYRTKSGRYYLRAGNRCRQATWEEVRRLYQRANELLDFFGITENFSIPIDPEIILRKMGIDIVPYHGLLLRFGAKGGVLKIKGKLQVWIDEDHYYNQPESSLLTLGEELGHMILHLDETDDEISSIQDWISIVVAHEEYYDFIENQARVFASNIILPSFIFDSYTLDWIDNNLDSINKYNNTTKEDLAYNISSLMDDFIYISPYIIEITLNRWPNPLIGQIIDKYPHLMDKKPGDETKGFHTS